MFAIYDTMQFIGAPVGTTCVGQAALECRSYCWRPVKPGSRMCAAARTRRSTTSRPVVAEGALPDLALQAKEIVRLRAEMEQILSRHTGQSGRAAREDTGRDLVLAPQGGGGLRTLVGRDPGQPNGCLGTSRRQAASASGRLGRDQSVRAHPAR